MRKQRASITVFTAIVLVAIMLVGFVSTDLACMLNADTIVNSASNLALDSALAGYDKVLYENYGLMGVQQDKINAPYQKVIKANLKNDKNYSNIFLFDNLNAKVEGAYPLSTTTVLEEQILNQIENGYVPNNFLADYNYLKSKDDFKLLSYDTKYKSQYNASLDLAYCQAYIEYLRGTDIDGYVLSFQIYNDKCIKATRRLGYIKHACDDPDDCELFTNEFLFAITESYYDKPTARKYEKINLVLEETLLISILFNYHYNSFLKNASLDEMGTKAATPSKTDGSLEQFNKNALTKAHKNIEAFWSAFGKKGGLPTLDGFYKELNDYLNNPNDKKLADKAYNDLDLLYNNYTDYFSQIKNIYKRKSIWDSDPRMTVNDVISHDNIFVNLDDIVANRFSMNIFDAKYDSFKDDYSKLSVVNKASGNDNFPADRNERMHDYPSLSFHYYDYPIEGKKRHFDFTNPDINRKPYSKTNCYIFEYDPFLIDKLSFLYSNIYACIKDCRDLIPYLNDYEKMPFNLSYELYYGDTDYDKTYSFGYNKAVIDDVNRYNSVQDETTYVIDSYIIDNFTCFTSEKDEENIFDKPKDNSFFPNCQIEYILNGLNFTGDGSYNSEISGVIYKIYGLRLAENYAAVCDYIKTKEFKKIALECSPYNIGNMQEYLATKRANDWIGLESLYETYLLINGGSVPAEKTLDNMHYDCIFEENEQDYSAPRTVVDYKSYLLAFLSTMDHDVKMERLSKLISMGMKNLTGEDKPLYTYYGYLKSTVEVDSRYLFLSQLKFTGFEQQNAAGAQRLRKETIRGY